MKSMNIVRIKPKKRAKGSSYKGA